MASGTRYDDLTRAITDAYPGLPNRLQGIARFALGNPDAMALSTVAKIAQGASVPPSAVIRFAKALGYRGFTQLQQIYRARLVERSATYRERIETLRRTGGDKGHVLPQLIDGSIHELERLREHFDVRRLAAATELVVAARTVYLLAQRRAFPVAGYLAYALAQLEVRAFLLDSVGGMLRQQVALIGRGDVLLAASFRSYTSEVVDGGGACAQARRKSRRHHRPPGVAPCARGARDTGNRRRTVGSVPLARGAAVRRAGAGDVSRIRRDEIIGVRYAGPMISSRRFQNASRFGTEGSQREKLRAAARFSRGKGTKRVDHKRAARAVQ